jgi:hypothetical protein
MARETVYELTENVTATLNIRAMSSTIKLTGGYGEQTPMGWALVISDRFLKRGIHVHLDASDDEATLTINGSGLDSLIDECIREIL